MIPVIRTLNCTLYNTKQCPAYVNRNKKGTGILKSEQQISIWAENNKFTVHCTNSGYNCTILSKLVETEEFKEAEKAFDEKVWDGLQTAALKAHKSIPR
jgi:hypothetical protein